MSNPPTRYLTLYLINVPLSLFADPYTTVAALRTDTLCVVNRATMHILTRCVNWTDVDANTHRNTLMAGLSRKRLRKTECRIYSAEDQQKAVTQLFDDKNLPTKK
jgi:predicted secreted protein